MLPETGVAETLLELLPEGGAEMGATWGACWCDAVVPDYVTPYEHYYYQSQPWLIDATRVRGYYWANYLAPVPLRVLGGFDRFAAQCAHRDLILKAVPLQGPADGALLLGSEAIADFTDERLQEVKEVLLPVLQHPPYDVYWGPPLRIIPDPGEARIRAPEGADLPHFDDRRSNKVPHKLGATCTETCQTKRVQSFSHVS